jgi:integrase
VPLELSGSKRKSGRQSSVGASVMATSSQFPPSTGVPVDTAPGKLAAPRTGGVQTPALRRRLKPPQLPINSHRSSSKPQRVRSGIIAAPPIRATRRKRGKNLSRRKGQNPKLRIGTRSDESQYFYFQYWLDVPGKDDRSRRREILGPVKTTSGGLTKTEAEAKKKRFLADLNNRHLSLPSSTTFADAVKHYREVFAPRMLRDSTYSVADGHLKNHLEPDWNNVAVDHINIDTVNDWVWKKKPGLSWVTIKNVLRTMQRVLSASSKSKTVPFFQDGLAIPERDKLQMKINSRKNVSYSWEQTLRIVEQVQQSKTVRSKRQELYSALFLVAAASGLRIGELLALQKDDIDFVNSTIRVDESVDRLGKIGPCKNVAAYRTVVLADTEGQYAMRKLQQFIKQDGLIFRSKLGGPLVENTILVQGLHPALKKVCLAKSGMHAFRRGCNRRWVLARVSTQMGHASASMTALYTGEIPLEQVVKQFQLEPNGAAAAA